LPKALIWIGSAAIFLHFFAVIMLVLAAQSGPWATHFGDSPAEGPLLAKIVTEGVSAVTPETPPDPSAPLPVQMLRKGMRAWYLQPLHLAHDYHFVSNRLMISQVKFEARLKDDKGEVTVLTFPDPGANSWIRHRQSLLALGLGDDMPVQPERGEVIPAPGQQMRTVTIWEPVKGEVKSGEVGMRLRDVPVHLVPKDRPVMRPSEWSLLLARSYARFLCREHGAASVEIVRCSKNPVMPALMFVDPPPPGTFDELVCSFGEYRREN
jgi:hypothetical protein